jgi:hypothetical protein
MDFKELLHRAGLNIQAAADYLGVSDQTIYRYIRHGAPVMAHRALEFKTGTNPDYYGLRFNQRGIWAETRLIIARRDIANFDWLLQREFIRGQTVSARK